MAVSAQLAYPPSSSLGDDGRLESLVSDTLISKNHEIRTTVAAWRFLEGWPPSLPQTSPLHIPGFNIPFLGLGAVAAPKQRDPLWCSGANVDGGPLDLASLLA